MVEESDAFEADPEPIQRYAEFVGERLVDLVKMAIADLKPARMGFVTGFAPDRVAYIRLYKMKDGTTMTCPPINDPNIDGPIGELDQRCHILRFDQEIGHSIILFNYGVHADGNHKSGNTERTGDWKSSIYYKTEKMKRLGSIQIQVVLHMKLISFQSDIAG